MDRWRRKWRPTPVFLPGEAQGRGSLVGSHRVGHDGRDSAVAAADGRVSREMRILRKKQKETLEIKNTVIEMKNQGAFLVA